MKTYKHVILTLSLLLLITGSSQAGIAVIVNKDNSIDRISTTDVGKIFLKKKKAFANGTSAEPIELNTPELKEKFYQSVAKKKETQLKSYWARMIFSGKAHPPVTATSASELKDLVAGDMSAIGFIDEKDVDSTVKVILTIE